MLSLLTHRSWVVQTRYYAIWRRWLQTAASPALFVGGPGKTEYRVRVTPSYAVECSCRHYEERMRPCSHAVAAIKVASTLMNLPQYQNVMDHRWLGTVWHLHTWRAQHTGVIKRVSLAGRAEQLKQEDLIPPRMHARSGRKRNKP